MGLVPPAPAPTFDSEDPLTGFSSTFRRVVVMVMVMVMAMVMVMMIMLTAVTAVAGTQCKAPRCPRTKSSRQLPPHPLIHHNNTAPFARTTTLHLLRVHVDMCACASALCATFRACLCMCLTACWWQQRLEAKERRERARARPKGKFY
jgi:hypothetical protein